MNPPLYNKLFKRSRKLRKIQYRSANKIAKAQEIVNIVI